MLDELDLDLVGAAVQPQRADVDVRLAMPVVAEQDPGLLAALQYDSARSGGARRAGSAPRASRCGAPARNWYSPSSSISRTPCHFASKPCGAAQPLAAGVVHGETIADGDMSSCCGVSVRPIDGMTVGTGQFSTVAHVPEGVHRVADLAPGDGVVDGERAVQAGAGQTEQSGECAAIRRAESRLPAATVPLSFSQARRGRGVLVGEQVLAGPGAPRRVPSGRFWPVAASTCSDRCSAMTRQRACALANWRWNQCHRCLGVAFLDQPVLGFAEIVEQHREIAEQSAAAGNRHPGRPVLRRGSVARRG